MKSADVYNENCPSRVVLEIISKKWVILIIDKLVQNPHQFGELKRQIQGVSPKVLTQLLKLLEANGLIIRRSYPVIPLKVEYSLSPLGISLSSICKSVIKWSEDHIEEIMLFKNESDE